MLAILAFLALRPGRGWLQKKRGKQAVSMSDDLPLNEVAVDAQSSGLHSLDDDPLLTYISGYLASRPHRSPAPGASRLAMPSGEMSALPADVQQLCVDWDDLELERAIGRGSFGRVYLGRWRQTAVAIKVLLPQGRQLPLESLGGRT